MSVSPLPGDVVLQEAGCPAVERPAAEAVATKPVTLAPTQLRSSLPLHWASIGSCVDVMKVLADPAHGKLARVLCWFL